MLTVVLVIHLMLAIAMIGVIMVQKSEGGALGIGGGGGGGGGMGGLMSARGSANLLSRTTAVLATLFIMTSLILAIMSGANRDSSSILDRNAIEMPAASGAPMPDTGPSVPVAK